MNPALIVVVDHLTTSRLLLSMTLSTLTTTLLPRFILHLIFAAAEFRLHKRAVLLLSAK